MNTSRKQLHCSKYSHFILHWNRFCRAKSAILHLILCNRLTRAKINHCTLHWTRFYRKKKRSIVSRINSSEGIQPRQLQSILSSLKCSPPCHFCCCGSRCSCRRSCYFDVIVLTAVKYDCILQQKRYC